MVLSGASRLKARQARTYARLRAIALDAIAIAAAAAGLGLVAAAALGAKPMLIIWPVLVSLAVFAAFVRILAPRARGGLFGEVGFVYVAFALAYTVHAGPQVPRTRLRHPAELRCGALRGELPDAGRTRVALLAARGLHLRRVGGFPRGAAAADGGQATRRRAPPAVGAGHRGPLDRGGLFARAGPGIVTRGNRGPSRTTPASSTSGG